MKFFIYLLSVGFFVTSCATVGSVIEGGKDIALTTVDTTVKTVGDVSGAVFTDVSDVVTTVAETYDGVVNTVVDNVDEQTDKLQSKEED